MLKVRGADPETVDLPDLNDRVYYGQEKIFSEAQYSRSQDLKRELKKGRLFITHRGEETFADYNIPGDVLLGSPQPTAQITQSNNEELKNLFNEKFEHLNNKIANLESGVTNQKPVEVKTQEVSSTLVEQLLAAIQSSSKNNSDAQMAEIKNHLLQLSEKMGNLSAAPVSKNQEITDENIEKRMQEVYVPSVTVQDTKNNVNLDIRVMENKDSVQDSLAKLKKLKQQG